VLTIKIGNSGHKHDWEKKTDTWINKTKKETKKMGG
jgi:hypothetical protein